MHLQCDDLTSILTHVESHGSHEVIFYNSSCLQSKIRRIFNLFSSDALLGALVNTRFLVCHAKPAPPLPEHSTRRVMMSPAAQNIMKDDRHSIDSMFMGLCEAASPSSTMILLKEKPVRVVKRWSPNPMELFTGAGYTQRTPWRRMC